MSTLKKPISDSKLLANRENAKKSTGPRTVEGKARSSRNSTTHGLTASLDGSIETAYCPARLGRVNPLEAGLTPTDLTALGEQYGHLPAAFNQFMASWNPATPYEASLVKRLAILEIRLDRCTRIETGLLDRDIPSVSPNDPQETCNSGLAMAFVAQERAFTNVSRYEANLSRAYDRTLKELLAVRKERLSPAGATDLPVCRGTDSHQVLSRPGRGKTVGDGETKPTPIENKRPDRRLTLVEPTTPIPADRRHGSSPDLAEPARPPIELVWILADGSEYYPNRPKDQQPNQIRPSSGDIISL